LVDQLEKNLEVRMNSFDNEMTAETENETVASTIGGRSKKMRMTMGGGS
jgi:hypothetical protein